MRAIKAADDSDLGEVPPLDELDVHLRVTIMTNNIGDMVMAVEAEAHSWTVAQAKARLSEVIEKARREPQAITRHGKNAVVVVDAELWERVQRREHRGSFADFLLASPLRGSGLAVERLDSGIREVEL